MYRYLKGLAQLAFDGALYLVICFAYAASADALAYLVTPQPWRIGVTVAAGCVAILFLAKPTYRHVKTVYFPGLGASVSRDLPRGSRDPRGYDTESDWVRYIEEREERGERGPNNV